MKEGARAVRLGLLVALSLGVARTDHWRDSALRRRLLTLRDSGEVLDPRIPQY